MRNYLVEGMDRFIVKQLQEFEESRKLKKKELCEDTSAETNMDRIDKVMDVVAAKYENEKEEAPAPKKERPAKRRRYSGTNMERIDKVLGDEGDSSTRIQERQKSGSRGSLTNMDRINKVLGINEEKTIKESEKNKRENKEMTVLESMNKGFEKKYGVPASSRKSLKEYKDVGQDVAEYQKWVDYDMKRYGEISDKTMEKIKSAGLSVTKDQYGQYEVIAKEAVREGKRNCRGRKKMTEAANGSVADAVYAHLSSDVADFADDELSLREMIDEIVEQEGSVRVARIRIIDELMEMGNQSMAEQGFETVEDIDAQIDYLKKLRDAVAAVDKYIR